MYVCVFLHSFHHRTSISGFPLWSLLVFIIPVSAFLFPVQNENSSRTLRLSSSGSLPKHDLGENVSFAERSFSFFQKLPFYLCLRVTQGVTVFLFENWFQKWEINVVITSL